MTLKSGTGQACAACKYQRRRCTSDCPLAPYFPADQPKMFANAHRLFGVSNILKILKQLDPSQKVIAMKSIKYQANMRDKYPVYGCLVEIQQLYYQIELAENELQAVLAQLSFYRQQHQQQEISSAADSMSQLQLGMGPPGEGLPLLHQENNSQQYNSVNALPIPPNASYASSGNAAYNTNFSDTKEQNVASSLWIQQPYSNSNHENATSMVMQPQLNMSQPSISQQELTQDYDEIHPFFDAIDDRQSYIDKEAYDSSSESSLRDTRQSQTIEHIGENELKNAAACFSLTSVN